MKVVECGLYTLMIKEGKSTALLMNNDYQFVPLDLYDVESLSKLTDTLSFLVQDILKSQEEWKKEQEDV